MKKWGMVLVEPFLRMSRRFFVSTWDADAALGAGYDLRHGLIGAGVYASHGYERSHVDGVKNTFELLKEYLK